MLFSGLRFLVMLLLCLQAVKGIAQPQPYAVFDTTGKHYFFSPPERVVVTDWTALENLLELGIVPVGAPEIERYQQAVRLPALPVGISDIGLRQAPNLNKIQSLKPDVIIIGTGQKELVRTFSRFGKVMYYKAFSDRYRDIGTKARERFLQLADLFRQRDLAERRLAQMDARLGELKQQLVVAYQHTLPSVLIVKPVNNQWLAYGENSLAGNAAAALGLQNVMAMGYQGEKQITLEDMQTKDYDYLLLLTDEKGDMTAANQFALASEKNLYLSYAWPFGGPLSVGRFGESIAAQLLRKTSSLSNAGKTDSN